MTLRLGSMSPAPAPKSKKIRFVCVPLRLAISVTAVVTALLKSSDIADMVTTLMQKNSSTPRKDEQ